MRVAVTGGTGLIGQEVIRQLLDDVRNPGASVICVDRWRHAVTSYEKARLSIRESLYETLPRCAAVIEPEDFLLHLKDLAPQVIIHAGAVVDTKDLGDGPLLQENVLYTQELTRAANDLGICMVFISSAAVYGTVGKPNNPYGLTKALGEACVRQMQTATSVLRLFNVFGRNEHHKGTMASVPWKIAQAYLKGDRIALHSLDASRDFISVDRVAAAIVHEAYGLINAGRSTTPVTWDVGTGVSTTFEDLDNYIMQATGNRISCVNWGEMPDDIRGRFQGYTRAGHMLSLLGAPLTRVHPVCQAVKSGRDVTRIGIEGQYGKS